MLRTLQNALDKVRGLIADPGGDEPLFSDELITAGLMDSLHAILPWVAITATSEFDGDGTTHQFELPADLYEVQAVHCKSSNSFIPRIGLFPGSIWTSGEGTAMDEQTFIEYPSGYISLAVPPNAQDKVTIFYTAYWPETTEAGDPLSPPEMCYPAMCYYAA